MSQKNICCSMNNCSNNHDGGCFAGAIYVAGKDANSTCCTECASFRSKNDTSNFTNCANCTCEKTNLINCQATECKHNMNKVCQATNVQINAKDASCETFAPIM